MRGKAKELPPRQCYLGITPAYAGKSVCRWSRVDPSWDHPRVCGEKHVLRTSKQKSGGSPPRMRGKGADQTTRRVFPGITPAYAGKSGFVPNAYSSSRDHPRVCGEKIPLLISSSSIAGSPPRMRGKAWADYRMKPNRGITPAYAGKRLKRSHRIGHFSCILCLFHSVLHRASASGGSRAGPCAPPCLPAQNAVPV